MGFTTRKTTKDINTTRTSNPAEEDSSTLTVTGGNKMCTEGEAYLSSVLTVARLSLR
jgi:hypothetical protein